MKIIIEMDTSDDTISEDYKKLLDLASGLNGLAHSAKGATWTPQPAEVSAGNTVSAQSDIEEFVDMSSMRELPKWSGPQEHEQFTFHSHEPLIVEQTAALPAEPIVQPEPAAPEKVKRTRRTAAQKAADESGLADIRAAEKAAMMEAIGNLAPKVTPPPELAALPFALPQPVATPTPQPVPAPPPQPPALVLPGSVPLPPPQPQTPAVPGGALALPHIPPNGQPMPLPDLVTVVRLSAAAGPGIAFTVMQKHQIFSPQQVPEDFRAQLAREIAIAANLITA